MKKKSAQAWQSSVSSHEPELLREVVREPEFEEATRILFKSVRRADEVLEGLEIFLSRRAEMGMAVRGYPEQFASWLSKPIPGMGRVRVVYHHDARAVTMLDAWLIPEKLDGQFFK
jgi:hypothetical protein